MAIVNIEVPLFKKMVMNGAINLKNHHQEVDELNVFPVPDGDTGTNMQMTVMSGVREMSGNTSDSIVEVSKSLSRGCLMGARGNSGVILSQFFRGLFVYIKELGKESLTVDEFLGALESGCKVAYKAVMEPVEGTILTVVREAAENTAAKRESFTCLEELLEFYLEASKASLANTPNLLPVLKEAGVVDSGGAGFVKIVEGMNLALKGVILEACECAHEKTKAEDAKKTELRYFSECVVDLNKPKTFNEADLKAPLSLLGHSLSCKRNGDSVKVSLHTNTPGRVLEITQKYGEFSEVKIENMHCDRVKDTSTKGEEPKKHFALISVCFGDGISQTFSDIGVDYVIEGGQTMNPATSEFVKAVNAVNAENVIIIPNNGNVVMAAEQAIPLCPDVNVQVLRAKTLAQGYASLMVYDSSASMETKQSIFPLATFELT